MQAEADILQVVASTARRGAELFAIDLASALERDGRRVRTVALAPAGPGGVALPTLGEQRLGVRTLRGLRTEARRAAVVVAHGSTTLPACRIAMFGLGVPLVYRNIGDPSFWNATRFRRWRTRRFLTRTDRIVALTQEARRRLGALGIDPARVAVIPNGVNVERFPLVDTMRRVDARAGFGLALDEGVAVYIGALEPEKNLAAAIRATARLNGVRLLVAGDGSEREALEELARAIAPQRVQFLGKFDDVSRVFAAADVVILPSLSEGLPAVLIEAGLSGVPAVASDVGFVNEIVADGRSGYLVDPSDGPGLADALSRAINAHRALGAAARARCVARFDLNNVAAEWACLLDEVVERHARERGAHA